MPVMTTRGTGRRRAVRVSTLLLATCSGLSGCNDFLKVTNPGAIETPALANPSYIPLMVNGVTGEFQPMFSLDAYYSGLFVDELRNHAVYFEEGLIDQRRVDPENGTYVAGIYNPMHRTRFLADSVVGRLKVLLGDSASRDVGLARVSAYAGYTYTLLGEQLCQTALNGQPRRYASKELLRDFALPRFKSAIAVATAARAAAAAISPATRGSAAAVLAADTVTNFALVGAARASLDLGDKAQAIQHASAVAPGFVFWAYHSDQSARQTNPFFGRLAVFPPSGSVSGTPFEGVNDPRVPLPADPVTVAGVKAYVPNSPSTFSTWTGKLPGGAIERSGSVRIASTLEAQYVLAEAQGPNAANVSFINTRRAIGETAPLPGSVNASDFFAALRGQRRLDFYLDTHRMGDLRRYKDVYGIDEWQMGPYPGISDSYGSQTCLPETLAEITNNPG